MLQRRSTCRLSAIVSCAIALALRGCRRHRGHGATEALKLGPDFALAANHLSLISYRQGKYAPAARWLENTPKIDPSRAVAYLQLGAG
jgi:hypothetical protein